MKKLLLLSLMVLSLSAVKSQHINGHYPGRTIDFPDIPGYLTLKADLHMHTVFSDGEVWPSLRVQEALRDGLDAIAITDHIEYQPHEADIPHPDRNRSFEIASAALNGQKLIIVNGAEVTRSMPPGHANAIFLEDANKLHIDDSVQAFREAGQQGAFVFWNHPHWEAQRPDGIARLDDLHKYLIGEKLLHGIEVVNDVTYSDEALQIALEHDLTIMGTSDVHGLVDWQYDVPSGGHRPVTLVFATDQTREGLKEALFAKRTAVYFNDMLIGREEFLSPLIMASLVPAGASYLSTWSGSTAVAKVMISNLSDAPFILRNKSRYRFHDFGEIVVIDPQSISEIKVKTLKTLETVPLVFEVMNAVSAPGMHPEIRLEFEISEE